MQEYDDPVTGMRHLQPSAGQLQAILDTPDDDDRTAPRASSLLKRVIHTTQSFFVGIPNSTHRSSSHGSQMRVSSNHALAIRNDFTDLAIVDSFASHSSPPSLASPPLVTTPARRLMGHSRDVPAKTPSTSDSIVPSRGRNLNAESNVQSRIAQFQRNVNVSATRALSNPSTKVSRWFLALLRRLQLGLPPRWVC